MYNALYIYIENFDFEHLKTLTSYIGNLTCFENFDFALKNVLAIQPINWIISG